MNNQDSLRFAKIMGELCEVFDRQPTKVLTDAYFNALADLDIETVERAARLAIAEPGRAFMPKPGELRQLIEGSADDQAQKAWGLLQASFRKFGYWQSVWIEDACLASAICSTFGGWIGCCEALHSLSDEMVASKRKEFLSNYRIAKRMPVKVNRYLLGMHETSNSDTSSTWQRGNTNPVFKQPVGIIGSDDVYLIECGFDTSTGRLSSGSRLMLEAFEYKEQLQIEAPKPKPKLALVGKDETGESVTLDEAIKSEDRMDVKEGLELLRQRLKGT